MNVSDLDKQKALLNRLSRVEGQVRGVKKLVQEGNDCEKVLQQMTAARRAMDKAFYEMLACVIEQEVLPEQPSDVMQGDSMGRVKQLLTKYA